MSPSDAVTLQAYIEAVDIVVREAEAKWGMERLPRLVDAELRAKFNRQVLSWQTALEEAWSSQFLTGHVMDAVRAKASAMQRAWAALDAAASEAGHRPIVPFVWEVVLKDGTVAALVQTDAEVGKVIAEGRHLVVYTCSEIARIIDAIPSVIADAKVVFPGSKVVSSIDRSWVKSGDEIPF